jgi:hypothetical protein
MLEHGSSVLEQLSAVGYQLSAVSDWLSALGVGSLHQAVVLCERDDGGEELDGAWHCGVRTAECGFIEDWRSNHSTIPPIVNEQ